MVTLRRLFIIPVFLLLPIIFSLSANSQELVENGGFETGDFTGWNTQGMTGDGNWFVYSGTISPIDGAIIQPPPVGVFAAVTDQGSPESNILYQDIELPANSAINCSAIIYYTNDSEDEPGPGPGPAITGFTKNSSPDASGRVFVNGNGLNLDGNNQQYRVDIMDPNAPPFDTGAGVLMNLFQTEPGDPEQLGYTPIEFDLSEYAGSTVRIRAAVAVTIGPLQGSIDEVSCIAGNPPKQVPTLSEWGMIAMAGILGIVGFMVARRRKITV